ncbi:MAG: DMT family transporter [Desulfobacterales bacterium]|nr:DMT family transporter [Desulfobacterales bacterium]
MLWILLSLLTALSVASQDACAKKFFSHLSSYEMLAYQMLYSLPLYLVTLYFTPIPPLDFDFWWAFWLSIPSTALAFLLYMTAIKISPLSLTLPYLAFTPTFMIFTGQVFLGEMPNRWGLTGVLITCMGNYILNLDTNNKSVFDPLKAVFKEKGSLMMLVVAFIFSFTAAIGKVGILHSSPMFFAMMLFSVVGIFILILFRFMGKIRFKILTEMPLKGAALGILYFSHAIFHSFAISLVKAAYMISIKRLSVLIGIMYGGLLFGEKKLFVRFIGAMIMVSGAVIIMLKGK